MCAGQALERVVRCVLDAGIVFVQEANGLERFMAQREAVFVLQCIKNDIGTHV